MTTEDITIRPSRREDLTTLRRFEQGVITAERPFDPTLKREQTTYYDLDNMLDATNIRLLVAEKEGRLVGSGYARIEAPKPYLQHSRHAYLGFMYVEEAYRGLGINRMIVKELENWSARQGVTELRLEVYYENAPAIKAYEKVGFSRHMIEMRKSITPDPAE